MSSSPVDDAAWTIRITSIPDAQVQSRRTLRILLVAQGGTLVLLRPNDFTVNQPADLILVPVIGVSVKLALGIRDIWLSATIVVASDTFAEVIGLNKAFVLAKVVAGPLPIEFVLVIAHENGTCDETCARSRL